MTSSHAFRAVAIVLSGLFLVPPADAAILPRPILKTFFETGDIPNEQDFKDLIDSALNLNDDGLVIYRIGTNSSGQATRLDAGSAVDGSLSFSPTSPAPLLAPNWLGQFGFLPLEIRDSTSASHFGFLQMQMASGPLPPPPGSPGPAIGVAYLVFETDANVPITTFFTAVPEPTSAVIFGFIVFGALAAYRRGWPCTLLQ